MAIPLLKTGWLLRQSSILKRWKKNWFILYADGNLLYFEDDSLTKREGNFAITTNCSYINTALECAVDPPEDRSYGSLMRLVARNGGDVVLCADSTDEALSWKMTMEQLVTTLPPQPAVHSQPIRVVQQQHLYRPYRRGCTAPRGQSYQVQNPVYYSPPYGPVEVRYNEYGQPYYISPHQNTVVVIREDDPYYYRRGDMIFGLAAGAMLGWALWTPFLFF